jgi:23S rRNA (pseudouridine1915-N3)-methyltransferase
MAEIRPDRFDPFEKHPSAKKILLDPVGKSLDSDAFARIFSDGEMQGHDLVFVVGGHDGLPAAWRPRADLLVSLSALTMPHELARAVLAEQIYRAFTMLRGHPYPR